MAGDAGPMSGEERLEVLDSVLRVGQAMLLGALNADDAVALEAYTLDGTADGPLG